MGWGVFEESKCIAKYDTSEMYEKKSLLLFLQNQDQKQNL